MEKTLECSLNCILLWKRYILGLSYQTGIMLMSLYHLRHIGRLGTCATTTTTRSENLVTAFIKNTFFTFFLLWWGVDPRWCYICQLHDSAANPTNLLITHNWFHITHQFSLVRLSSVRLSLRWALQKRPMKAKSPDLKISFCFSLFSSLFLFRFRCLVALGSESDL